MQKSHTPANRADKEHKNTHTRERKQQKKMVNAEENIASNTIILASCRRHTLVAVAAMKRDL